MGCLFTDRERSFRKTDAADVNGTQQVNPGHMSKLVNRWTIRLHFSSKNNALLLEHYLSSHVLLYTRASSRQSSDLNPQHKTQLKAASVVMSDAQRRHDTFLPSKLFMESEKTRRIRSSSPYFSALLSTGRKRFKSRENSPAKCIITRVSAPVILHA